VPLKSRDNFGPGLDIDLACAIGKGSNLEPRKVSRI